MKRRRRKNPFNHPHLYEKGEVNEALTLIHKIVENSRKAKGSRRNPYEPAWDESLVPELDPENIYTPLNIVAHSLEPKVAKQVLKALLSDEAATYRDVVSVLEEETNDTYDMNTGVLPPSWLRPRKRGVVQLSSPFDRDFGEIGGQEMIEKAKTDLNWGASRRRRLRRRRY